MIIVAKYTNHANAVQAGSRESGSLKRRRFPPHPNPLTHRDGEEGEQFRVFRVVRGSSGGWQLRRHGYNAGNGNWSTHNYYHADDKVTGSLSRTNLLAPTGLVLLTQGGRSYPVAYAYDAQGRLQTMTTWKDF
ncbi:MAG: hypothetical protein GYA76_11005, partial [Verrucomicrobia bacterium]|nr:hypothetical protein [Verrucomicrobiota bacterium]